MGPSGTAPGRWWDLRSQSSGKKGAGIAGNLDLQPKDASPSPSNEDLAKLSLWKARSPDLERPLPAGGPQSLFKGVTLHLKTLTSLKRLKPFWGVVFQRIPIFKNTDNFLERVWRNGNPFKLPMGM